MSTYENCKYSHEIRLTIPDKNHHKIAKVYEHILSPLPRLLLNLSNN